MTLSSLNRNFPIIGRERRPFHDSDTLVLSRFAYMRRRGNEMVLELLALVRFNFAIRSLRPPWPYFYTAPH